MREAWWLILSFILAGCAQDPAHSWCDRRLVPINSAAAYAADVEKTRSKR
jgi:hypothetical protein